jgi:hypothetical protein
MAPSPSTSTVPQDFSFPVSHPLSPTHLKLGLDRFGQSSLMNLSPPAGGGLLREDSGGDFFEWWCGELVKGALRSEVQ